MVVYGMVDFLYGMLFGTNMCFKALEEEVSDL
jgi:hypothetical protein